MSFLKHIIGEEKLTKITENTNSVVELNENELNELLNEAAFNENKIEKVVKLYSSIFSKKFGAKFKKIGKEAFKRKSGKKGIGIRYMAENGVMLRFNWDQKSKSNYIITSIEYWKEKNYNFAKPTRTVEFTPEANVVQILDKAMDALKTGIIKESYEAEVTMENLDVIDEAKSRAEKEEWAKAHGIAKSAAGSTPYLKKKAEEKGVLEELLVFLGEDEENTTSQEIKKTEKEFKKEVFANPETVFDDIEDLTFVIAKKKWKSLIICGMGGIGKCASYSTELNVKGL